MLFEQDENDLSLGDIYDDDEYNILSAIETNNIIPNEAATLLQEVTNNIVPNEATAQESTNMLPKNTEAELYPRKAPTVIDLTRQYTYEDEHIQESIDIFALMVKGTRGKTLYDAVIKRINQYTNGYLPLLYSYSKS